MIFFLVVCCQILLIIPYTNAARDDNFALTIIHINDFHSRYDEINALGTKCKGEIGEKCIGGYARTVSAVKMLQENAEHSIYLNAGDNFQGTLWYDKFKGNLTSYLLNLYPCDAITIGNHEFDDGIAGLIPFLTNIKSSVVVCNIDEKDEPTLKGLHKKSVILNKGGKKIGVIGVILTDTPNLSRPEKLIFLDEIESIKAEIINLKQKHVDIIIVLSHCGLNLDRQIAIAIGEDINVIVGSHSHTLLYNGAPPNSDKVTDKYPVEVLHPSGKKTLIVQAAAFSKYIGNLTVYFGESNEILSFEGNPIYMDENILQDQGILDELKPFQDVINEIGNEQIGSSKILLEKDVCIIGECSYSNLITDAYVDYYVGMNSNEERWTLVPIAFTNAGIIRVGLNKGKITLDDLATSHPYENTVDTFEIRGEYLLEALEISASKYGTVDFLQFSGLHVIIDIGAPKGQRIKSVKVRCGKCTIPIYEYLDRDTYYHIAIASWIGDGGNGYQVFKNRRTNLVRGPTSLSVVEQYLRKISPVIGTLDRRIKIFNETGTLLK